MRRRELLFALLTATIVAALFFRALLPVFGTHILTDDFQSGAGRSDAYTFLWGTWWTHHALSAGQSPFTCDWVLPPTGVDLRFHTILWTFAALTTPLAGALPPAALYNLIVLGMLVGAAVAFFAGLRRGAGASFPAALVGGVLFGFAPYFVFKAHVHPNLIGAFSWATALAVLMDSLAHGRSSWRRAGLFAFAFWFTFWTSLVEAAMLAGVVAIQLAVAGGRWAIGVRADQEPPGRRLALGPPAFRALATWLGLFALGLPSVFFFAGGAADLQRALVEAPRPQDWIHFPTLSLWRTQPPLDSLYEYGGLGISWGLVALVFLGLGRPEARAWRRIAAPAFVLTTLVAVNPGGLVSGALQFLPGADAFRVYARFWPFALFFLGVLAVSGTEIAFRPGRWPRRALAIAAVATALLEIVPRAVPPSPVVSLNVPADVRASLDESRSVLVLPDIRDRYPRRREAYQVELEMPFVRTGDLTRDDPARAAARAEAFPFFYGDASRVPVRTPEDLLAQFRALGVGYILFDPIEQAQVFPVRGRVLHQTERELLMELP